MQYTMTFVALCAGQLLSSMAISAMAEGDAFCADEDEQMASLLEGSCEWNTYMCCWTGNEGSMTANADVCRVLGYPEEGDVLEMPRDDEGPVYCHGFAWEDGADISSNILPLYHYVKNFGGGSFYGSVEGTPECGCIEDMPVVDYADCSRHASEGIVPHESGLLRGYMRVGEPSGPMDFNLVGECDNSDVPQIDFGTCDLNTYMCCWTENDGMGMSDNTDVCYVGDRGYPGESEGEVHCHGFAWAEDASDQYIHTLAQYVQNFQHRDTRGYFGNLPGAPMCGCIEDMPEVSKADCSMPNPELEGRYMACTDNDLRTRFLELYPRVPLDNLVGECDNK